MSVTKVTKDVIDESLTPVGGSVDAIVLTPTTAITAYAAGQTYNFLASGANTAAVTVAISGLAAKAITKNGATALIAGDIASGAIVSITYDGTRFILNAVKREFLPLVGGTLLGNLLFTDATFDIGASGATRPRDLFLSRNSVVGGSLTANGGVLGTVVPGGHIFGLTLSNNSGDATNDIDIAIGEAASVHATPASRVLLVLASALTKRLDATWVTGTNQGGRSSSVSLTNTTYHVFLMRVGGVDDIGFDTSATGANLVTDHSATHVRRIGSILRESATIVAFVQGGDNFARKASILDVNATNPGTSAVTRLLSVPAGIQVLASINVNFTITGGVSNLFLSDLDMNDEQASGTVTPLATVPESIVNSGLGGHVWIRTSNSATIRSRISASDAGTVVRIATLGWLDSRGRHG